MSKQGVKRYFFFIKKQVSSDWKDLAECLDFETPDIENIEGKHRDDKSRCMELLQQWYKREGNAATIHVLMEALQVADLNHVVDSLKDRYLELKEKPLSPTSSSKWKSEDLPVHLNLGTVQQPTTAGGQAGDIAIDVRVLERILELERTLFTIDVLRDPARYEETRKIFLKHKALLKKAVKGSFILLLTFLRQTDVDRFYHNHYRVGEGTLSQQLSHILISDDLQDKVKGAQLIVRLQVKQEDYVRVRNRLGQGLDISVNNLLALPPPSKHVDRSSLRGLDLAVIGREELAVIGREDQPCADGTDDITMPYRQVQSVLRTAKEKSKVQLETTSEKIQQLQETNKSMEARIEELLTAKQPVASGSQQEGPAQTKPDQHSMDIKSTATNTGEVGQSVVQGFIPTGEERRWVKKVSFGGFGSDRGKFRDPMGVAVSKDYVVFIADCYRSTIQVFIITGVYIREFTTTLPGETGEKLKPLDVTVDRNDNLWATSYDHVVQYSREGTCLATIDLPCVPYPRGIAVAMATEQVIVTEFDMQNGRLRVFNQDGSEVGTYGAGHRSPKPWWPQYVTVDGEGNILVTDVNNHCVHVLDREGNFKFKFGSEGSDESQFKSPQGICVDGMGNIIVADRGNGCVKMFDSQGRFLCYIGSGMEAPSDVAVSPGGDVVVTDRGDSTVSVWTQG